MKLLTRLPPGWVEIVTAERERFEDEYAAEIANGHPLYGAPVRTIAKRNDCDKVLFGVHRHLCSYAVVHLTWSGQEELPPDQPHFDLYTDEADLISELGKRQDGRR